MVKENMKESIIFIFEEAISDLEREVNLIRNDLIEYTDAGEVMEWFKGWVFDPVNVELKLLQPEEGGDHEERRAIYSNI